MTSMGLRAVLSVCTTWTRQVYPWNPVLQGLWQGKGTRKSGTAPLGKRPRSPLSGVGMQQGNTAPFCYLCWQAMKSTVDQEWSYWYSIWSKRQRLGWSRAFSLLAERSIPIKCCGSATTSHLLDGHSSHFKPQCIHFAKDNQIIIFCLPPHTTHECQLLDCGLFGPLKQHWQRACHSFYQKNPGLSSHLEVQFLSNFQRSLV